MLWILDILLWIRGSVSITKFPKLFCLLLFEGTFGFKDKKTKRSHKTVDIKVCFTISAGWWKDPDPGGQKLMDPPDLNPQDHNTPLNGYRLCHRLCQKLYLEFRKLTFETGYFLLQYILFCTM